MNSMTLENILQSKILVVDDKQANVDLLTMILELNGYCHISGVTDPRLVVDLCKKK